MARGGLGKRRWRLGQAGSCAAGELSSVPLYVLKAESVRFAGE